MFRSSWTVHRGSAIGFTRSARSRVRIQRANREVGWFNLWMRSARFRRGWYGSRRAVQATKVHDSLSSSISAGRMPDSFRRARVGVVQYTGKMALALLYVTLSNRCKWASIQFEIREEPDLQDLPGHQVSAAKYATRSTQAVTARCRRIGAIPCVVLPRDLRAFPIQRALVASSWAWGRKLSL